MTFIESELVQCQKPSLVMSQMDVLPEINYLKKHYYWIKFTLGRDIIFNHIWFAWKVTGEDIPPVITLFLRLQESGVLNILQYYNRVGAAESNRIRGTKAIRKFSKPSTRKYSMALNTSVQTFFIIYLILFSSCLIAIALEIAYTEYKTRAIIFSTRQIIMRALSLGLKRGVNIMKNCRWFNIARWQCKNVTCVKGWTVPGCVSRYQIRINHSYRNKFLSILKCLRITISSLRSICLKMKRILDIFDNINNST